MKIKQIIKNIYRKNICIYCEDRIWKSDDKHFISCCCGRGMCENCFNGGVGTMEQWQMDYIDDEDYEKQIAGTNIEGKGDYCCFECFDNGNIYKLTNK